MRREAAATVAAPEAPRLPSRSGAPRPTPHRMRAVSHEPAPAWLRKLGMVLLVVWAVVFVLGAAGEIFNIPFLRDFLDFKRVFLR